MKIKTKASIIIIVGFITVITSQFSVAIDAPHNASNNISCGDCHAEALTGGLTSPFWGGSYTPADIDDTVYNKLCLKCHTASSGPYAETNAPLEKTHSSLTTSNKYGDWAIECRNCHDPHYQRQKNYKNTDPNNYYLATGTITGYVYYDPKDYEITYSDLNLINTTILEYDPSKLKSRAGWEDITKLTHKTGDCRRALLLPNVNKLGYCYPIIAVNTSGPPYTITVKGDASPVYQYITSSNFAVIYGQYVKDSIYVQNQDGSGTYKTVKLFDKTGQNSFAYDETGTGEDPTPNGICQVCHSDQTNPLHLNPAHWRADGTGADHYNNNVYEGGCIYCHSHTEGFKPNCNACHGYPPVVDTPASPDGLVWVAPLTGSTTSGEHQFHATSSGKNYKCDVCHYNNLNPVEDKHNKIPRNITMGFYIFDGVYQGGEYDGQVLSPANYDATTTTPGTAVSETGTKKCSNIYCHGGTMTPDGGTATAIWDDPSSAACGTCHGATAVAPPTRGSHSKHAGSAQQLPCSDCHNGYVPSTIPSGMATHVNNQANFAFDTSKIYIGSTASYNGTPIMLDAYGQCSNTYCHRSTTPTWGGASIACNGCHNASNTGLSTRHDRHYNTATVPSTLLDPNAHTASAYVYGCSNCHPTTSHARGPVSSVQDAEINGTKILSANYTAASSNLTDAKGFKYTTYGTCITVCHTRDGASGLPIVAAAWGTAPTSPNCGVCHNKAGDVSPVWSTPHTRHINTYSANTNFTCNACHSGTATNNTTINGAAGRNQHPNGVKDVAFNSFAGGSWTGTQCQNTYCHSNGTSITGSHPVILWSGTVTCSSCHPGTNIATGSHTKHVTLYDCTKCHNVTVSNSSTISNYANHVNKLIDVAFDTASHVNGTYNSVASPVTKTPGTAYSICTNITCHNNGTGIWSGTTGIGNTPQWGTAGGCNSCHGNTTYTTDYRKGAPLYASGSPKPNAHPLHTDARTTPSGEPQCNNCHRSVTNSNTAIDGTTPSDHVNDVYNVVAGNTYKDGDNVGGAAVSVTTTYTYKGTPNTSTCSNVSCHPTGLAGSKSLSSTTWDNAYRCTDCHNINMNNTTGYHHVMDSTAMADRTYPTSAPSPSDNPIYLNRKCTMCHVDHNFFSPMLNVNNTNGRSYNLRTAIGTTPTSTAGYTNSDYATGGGICISCHTTELAKNRTTQKDDGTTVTVAVTDNRYPPRDSSHPNLRNHNYNVSSTMSDGSTFNANCSKCHNAKTNETTTFQSSTYKFGTHDDTARRLLAALGGTLTENYEEAFCYRCHSKATDPIGGTKKSADVNDWYGAVTNMDPKSTGIYQAFQKLGFTTATNVLYFRRSMPAGRVPTDSESTDTFQGGNWQLKEMLPTAGTSLYEDEQRFTPDNGGNSVFWKMTSFVSPPVPTTTIIPAGGWGLLIWASELYTNANAFVRVTIYVWTFENVKGTVIVSPITPGGEVATTDTGYYYSLPGGAVTLNSGDRIVVELELETRSWSSGNVSYKWDGTTRVSSITFPSGTGAVMFLTGYGHNVRSSSGLHKPSPTDETSAYLSANRHVECGDCHNPHTIGGINPDSPPVHPLNRTTTRTLYGNRIDDTTFGSQALQGVWGLTVTSWPTNWGPPGYSIAAQPIYEAQICIKCHSSYALSSPTFANDIAAQLNPNACSGHPIVYTQNNNHGRTPNPRALASTQMLAPFNTYVGDQTMYCSDCHGNDVVSATDPQGPHASSKPNLFIQGRTWPERYPGGYWSLNNLYRQPWDTYYPNQNPNYVEDWRDTLLCAACHVIHNPTSMFINNAHNAISHYTVLETGKCINCHQTEMHGGHYSRLIGGPGTKIRGFKKASYYGGYEMGWDGQCYAPDSECGHIKSDYTYYDCEF